jgi:hypothetical protein
MDIGGSVGSVRAAAGIVPRRRRSTASDDDAGASGRTPYYFEAIT